MIKSCHIVSLVLLFSLLAMNASARIITLEGQKYFKIGPNTFRLGSEDMLTEGQVDDIFQVATECYERLGSSGKNAVDYEPGDISFLNTLWNELNIVYRGSRYDDLMLLILRAQFNRIFSWLRYRENRPGIVTTSRYGRTIARGITVIKQIPYCYTLKVVHCKEDTRTGTAYYDFILRYYSAETSPDDILHGKLTTASYRIVEDGWEPSVWENIDAIPDDERFMYIFKKSDGWLNKILNRSMEDIQETTSNQLRTLYYTVTPEHKMRRNSEIDKLMIKVVKKANEEFHKDIAKAFGEAFLPYFNSLTLKNELAEYCSSYGIRLEIPKAPKKDF